MLRWETRGRTAAPVPAGPDDREMPAVDTAPVPFVNRRAGARSSGGRGATPWTDPPTLTAPAPSDGIARGRRLSALRRGAAAPAAEPVIRRTRVDALARAELDGEDASQRLLDLLRDPKTPEDRRRELVKANNDGLAETDLDYIDLDRLRQDDYLGGLTGGSPDGLRTLTRDVDFEVLEVFDSGSTKPEKIRLSDGSIKVLKLGRLDDREHIRTEILTQQLYSLAGIPTLPAEYVMVDGEPGQLTDFVEAFTEPALVDLRKSPDFWRHVAADMIFANWDMFKTANWMEIAGRMIRADLGGALDRRAQGGKKDNFGPKVDELSSMVSQKDPKSSPYARLTEHEIADSIRNLLLRLTPDSVAALIAESGLAEETVRQLTDAVTARLEHARAWADQHYPMAEVHEAPLVASIDRGPRGGMADEGPDDPWEQLEGMGWAFADGFMALAPDDRSELLRSLLSPRSDLSETFLALGGNQELVEPGPSMARHSPDRLIWDLLALPHVTKSEDPREAPPLVGPEELLRADQYGDGRLPRFIAALKQLETGVLMRRMSDEEKAAFIAALNAEDITEIVALLFTTGGRGEIVFSVNEPFVFERERKKEKGEALTAEEAEAEEKESAKYHWIMEIPMTSAMVDFLERHAYESNPVTAKSMAFMGNPNLKFEGAAGGSRDSAKLPNIVIKPQGFEQFWRSVRQLRFVKADQHLWRHRSGNDELERARIEKQRNTDQEVKSEERKARKQKNKEIDDFDIGGLFGPDEPKED